MHLSKEELFRFRCGQAWLASAALRALAGMHAYARFTILVLAPATPQQVHVLPGEIIHSPARAAHNGLTVLIHGARFHGQRAD